MHHYNLNKEKQLIGNTHYAFYLLQNNALLKQKVDTLKELTDAEIASFMESAGPEAFQFARKCGSLLQLFRVKAFNKDVISNLDGWNRNVIDHYYADYNTNRKSNLFPKGDDDKAMRLYLLHTLTTINYVLVVLNQIGHRDSGLLLKMNYISYYYAVDKLKSLHRSLSQQNLLTKEIQSFFELFDLDDNELISSDFRNCLMHPKFDTPKSGAFLIQEQYFDYDKPYFGLIECNRPITQWIPSPGNL